MKYAVLYYKKDPFGESAVSIAVIIQNSKGVKAHFLPNYMDRVLREDPNADQYIMKNLQRTLTKKIEEEPLYLSSPSSKIEVAKTDPTFISLLSAGYRGNIQFKHIQDTTIPNARDAIRELEKIYA